MAAKKVTIEEKMSRIDVIIQALEQEDTTLQDCMKYYKEGVKLLKECDGMLDKVEKEIEELTKEQDDGE